MSIKIDTQIIKDWEQFRQYPYKCSAGKWTIGYGTTVYPSGVPVKEDDNSINEKLATDFLNSYIDKEVKPCIEALCEKVKLKQNQINALASLLYNIDANSFNKSKLKKAIIDNDKEQIYRQWDWIKAGGKVQNGLIARRAYELYIYFRGY